MKALLSTDRRNNALRGAMTISTSLVIANIININLTVFMAMFSVIFSIKVNQDKLSVIVKIAVLYVGVTITAIFVNELFFQHPFVIWTISLLFFLKIRSKVTSEAKLGMWLLPTFLWALMTVFYRHLPMDMHVVWHEVFLCALISGIVYLISAWLFPVTKSKPPICEEYQVTSGHLLASLLLMGSGMAFLMLVNLIPAVFCMVGCILISFQRDPLSYLKVLKSNVITQVGGCAVALIFALLMMGHQNAIGYYALLLFILSFTMVYWGGDPNNKDAYIHKDIILTTVVPIALYIKGSGMDIGSIYERALTLSVAFALMYILCIIYLWLNKGKTNYEYQ
jgi:hypothetical protein